MDMVTFLWPRQDERRLLGCFYLIDSVSEAFNVIWPFQFAYLFMVMERPEWAVIPLFVESLAGLVVEIPAGALADRYGRRITVILGDVMTALGLALVPLATLQTSTDQLLAVCLCFGIAGIGQAMVSGAAEAWVVDNLTVLGRRDLIDNYFGRVHSYTAMGAVLAGIFALLLLLNVEISRDWLDSLWYIAAGGILLGVMIQTTIPELRPEPHKPETLLQRPGWLTIIRLGFRAVRNSRMLMFFVIAMVAASFPEAATDDAFDMSLITKGMDARWLAPLGIVNNLLGIAAPLLGMLLLRRFGATRVLTLFLILPACAASFLFVTPTLGIAITLYILLEFFDRIWDPVAYAHLQSMLESESRATVASIADHAGGIMELLGIAVFAWLLGEHSDQLSESVPDLITAFSGGATAVPPAPLTDFLLSVPDLAIVVFVFSALLALPFLLLSNRKQPTSPVTAVAGSDSHAN